MMLSWNPSRSLMLLILVQVLMVHGRLLTLPIPSVIQELLGRSSYIDGKGCFPLEYPIEAQCSHVQEHCPETSTFLSLAHLQRYFCAMETSRPFVLLGLLLWMSLLFSTLGICASDFLCPNLSTIAHVLGLDDSVAGVTLLAIGNGSPDLFATFSAMKANSGSLAIGELLGAASFIVSVVVGSMCIIKPFYVHPRPFLRDVGFFTIATGVILWILHDGILRRWEVNFLIGLYSLYVCLVVAGTWWEKRRERRRLSEAIVREEFISDNHPLFLEPYQDEVSHLDVRPSRSRAISTPNPPRVLYPVQRRSQSRSPPRLSPMHTTASDSTITPSLPHFSLLTALEFRDIVSSLQHQATFSRLSLLDNSIGSLTSRQYRTPSVRSHFSLSQTPVTSVLENENSLVDGAPNPQATRSQLTPEGSPTMTNVPPAIPPQNYVSRGFNKAVLNILYLACRILFPHLHDFSEKSFFSLAVAILATPGVVTLTLTIPVVPSLHDSTSDDYPIVNVPEGQLIDSQETQTLEVQDFCPKEHQSNKWLVTVQCILGPPFCAVSLLGFESHALWYISATAIGLVLGVLSLIFSKKMSSPVARLGRCLMGFIIAVVWIMVIADEVVSVLKAFGLIFGLSDAIVGLTVFAVGNSLADLVANTSVAAFAPIMGFSACFGGPMLNILLGIGVSGSLIIQETGHNYNLHFSTTLLITVISLLIILIATLIFVPWNGFFLTRSWGVFLIIYYIAIMAVDILVEMKHSQNSPP